MSIFPLQNENPYRSPVLHGGRCHSCEINGTPGSPLDVQLEQERALYRRIRLRGELEATIEWDANHVKEFVRVNGDKVVSKHAFFSSIPQFQFELITMTRIHRVTIDLCVRWVFLLKAFRIVVDHRVVYSEGDCLVLPALTSGSVSSHLNRI